MTRIITLGCLFVIGNLSLFFQGADAFSVSVPALKSVCRSMVPGHDKISPQQSPSPYFVTTDVTQVRGGESLEVTINAKEGNKFKGFYIQARDAQGSPIGTFNENTYVKTHSCGGIKSNGAHHMSPELKERVQVSWTAPANYKGTVQIQATVVQSYTTFWTPNKANPVSVS